MDEKKPWQIYREIFSEAIALAISDKKAFFFAFVASIASADLFLSLFEKNAPLAAFADTFSLFSERNSSIILLSVIAFTLLYIFSKGTLLLELNASLEKKSPSLKKIRSSAVTAFPRYLAFELLVILFLSTVFFLLNIPAFLSQGNEILSKNLSLLGTLVFLPIFVTGVITELFGSFYLLFSKVSLRSAFELGYTLFAKNIRNVLLFSGLSILLFVLFTILLGGTLHIFGTIFSAGRVEIILSILIFYLCQSLFLSFSKTAWVSFFRSIAKGKVEELALQTGENVIEKTVPELEHDGERA
jgi:hypothetical protein